MISTNKESTLKGSSILSGLKASKGISRMDHYISNTLNNKVLNYYLEKGYSDKQAAELIKKDFVNYREGWINQPKDHIKKLKDNCQEPAPKRPLSLDLELAAICDLACPYCFRQTYVTPDKIMPKELAFNLIDQAADIGIPSIKFNWRGEPLLHPNITQIINYAKKKGILDTIINTNATQLNKDMAEKLIESGLDQIIYSFDGGTKETYEKNRIGRFRVNKFDDVYKNIRNFNLVKKNLYAPFPWTKIQMILTPDTYDEQESFIDLFSDCVDEVVVNQYSERGQSIDQLSNEDKKKYDKKIKNLDFSENIPFMKLSNGEIKVSKRRLPCEQPFQRIMVTYDGRVSMCCYDWGSMYTIGYVSDKCFKDINYDKYYIQESIKKEKKAFKDMSRAVMPPQFNLPKIEVKSLVDIWNGDDISKVRLKHAEGNANDINICRSCTFKDTYEWI
tara:strand:+ start:72242 stop:73582 length:1341 start_codon:yes stop_codon:yes gene_type:complete